MATELGLIPAAGGSCDVVVCSLAPEQNGECAAVARELRGPGCRVVLDASKRKLDKKLRDADRQGARWVVIIGEREVSEGVVSLREVSSGSAATISRTALKGRIAGISND